MGRAAAVSTYRWTRKEYETLAAQGFFAPDRRLQLIDGEIYNMSPQGSRHTTVLVLAHRLLAQVFDETAFVIRAQCPLALGEDSEPEPDLAVVEGKPKDYLDAHPQTAVLVVEVSDNSLNFDRTTKLALYARNAIPEYWILNLEDSCLEVYRQPVRDEYRLRQIYRAGNEVSPLDVEGAIPVVELLP